MTHDDVNGILVSILGKKYEKATTPSGSPTHWIKGIPTTILLINGLVLVYNTIPFAKPRTFSDLFDFQDWVVANLI